MKEDYKRYLESQEWAHVRQDAFREHGDGCMACGKFATIQLHHVFYPRDIWATTSEHVIPLCSRCHDAAHHGGKKPFTYDIGQLHATKTELLARLRATASRVTFNEVDQNQRRIAEVFDRSASHRVQRQKCELVRRVPDQAHKETRRHLERIAKALSPTPIKLYRINDAALAARICILFRIPEPETAREPRIVGKDRRDRIAQADKAIAQMRAQMTADPTATRFVFHP